MVRQTDRQTGKSTQVLDEWLFENIYFCIFATWRWEDVLFLKKLSVESHLNENRFLASRTCNVKLKKYACLLRVSQPSPANLMWVHYAVFGIKINIVSDVGKDMTFSRVGVWCVCVLVTAKLTALS